MKGRAPGQGMVSGKPLGSNSWLPNSVMGDFLADLRGRVEVGVCVCVGVLGVELVGK